MPVTLSARAVGDALARLQEHALDPEPPLAWLGWDWEGPLRVRRYDLLVYLWYQLPTKYLAPLETKRDVAAALAALLEQLGADEYAALCRAPEVEEMLALWEADDTRARRRLRELLDASELEPPDTELLAWGAVMGLVEADARDRATEALELAHEAGDGAPARAIVANVLAEPTDEGTRLDAIHAERLERWRGRGEPRRAIVDRVVEELGKPVLVEAGNAVEPARWLLERGEEGITLTQTRALPRSLVREAVERWPEWWRADLLAPPHRETDVASLHRLHGLLRETRLLRRSGRRLRATARGRRLRQRPDDLLARCAEALLSGDTSWAVSAFLLRAEPVGIVVWDERRLTAAGRAALHHGLRARALGPAQQSL